jgi:hypothetical protein
MKMIILVQSKKTKKIRSPNQRERKADLKAIKRRKIKKRMGLNKMEIKKKIKAKLETERLLEMIKKIKRKKTKRIKKRKVQI